MLRKRSAAEAGARRSESVIAIEIGTLVGRGRTAEIYAVGDGRVLKLLLPDINSLVLEREDAHTAAAHDGGAPAPAVFGPMSHGGRPGMVFERVRGPALARALVTRPWRLRKYARLMADVHFDLHTRRSAALPDLRERLAAKIDASDALPLALQRIAKELVDLDSSGDHVLHGDLHADNVLLSPRGPMVIDWLDASRGVPAADIGRSQWLSSAAVLPPRMPFRPAAVAVLTRFGSEYLRHYLERSGMMHASSGDGVCRSSPPVCRRGSSTRCSRLWRRSAGSHPTASPVPEVSRQCSGRWRSIALPRKPKRWRYTRRHAGAVRPGFDACAMGAYTTSPWSSRPHIPSPEGPSGVTYAGCAAPGKDNSGFGATGPARPCTDSRV